MAIDGIRNNAPLPWKEILDRAQTERLDRLLVVARLTQWEDEKLMVAAFDLAIEQRDSEVCGIFFGSKPPRLPQADWQRMKEVTGIAQFQSTH